MSVHKDLYNEVKTHYNEICIDYLGRLVRLVGAGESDTDWYYIIQPLSAKAKHWLSASSDLIYLQSKISDVEYNTLDRMFVLSGVPEMAEALDWKFNN